MKNANQVLALPDQRTYYNAVQLSLPVSTLLALDQEDTVFSFLEAVEGVDFSKYVKPIRSNNTNSHDRGMLIRTMLFGYMNGVNSLAELSALCRTDLRYLYLSNEEKPSKMAFSRLSSDLTEQIDQIFFDINGKITVKMDCDTNIQYIDGTKIEANANKNTFVYKKRIINARERLYIRITEDICQLNQTYGYNYPYGNRYCAYDMWNICQYLMEVMVRENTAIVYGKGHRKNGFQMWYDTFLQYAMKLEEYEYWLAVMEDRNSCSKIDHDATMMATKWDYYNQSGVTRACYNCQIAVSDGIIVNSEVFQTAADTGTYQPFMEKYHEYTGRYPEYPVADAGYGSYDNYMYNVTHECHLTMKYNMYGKEHDKNFQKRKFNSFNWKKNEDGYVICPDGRVFDQYERDVYRETAGGNLSISQLYYEPRKCKDCPFRKECLQNQDGYRHYTKNVIKEEFWEKVNEELSTEEGIHMKIQRSVQVEGAFGVIKQDFRFTRFHRRGMKNVKMEFLLVCLGYNLKKFHLHRLREMRINPSGMLS